jgi:hypothetical protein
VITKLSAADYDATWQDSGGGTGNVWFDGSGGDSFWYTGGHNYPEDWIIRGGIGLRDLYINSSGSPVSATSGNAPRDGTSWKSAWTQLAGGMCYRGVWASGNSGDTGDYEIQDVVSRSGKNYLCTQAHDADTSTAQPGTGATWTAYWVVVGNDASYNHARAGGKLIKHISVKDMYAPTTSSASAPAVVEIGTSTPKTNLFVSYFDASADEYLFFAWTPPHNWDRTLNPGVRMRFYWFPTTTNTGNVYWYGYVRGFDDGDLLETGPSSINGVLDAGNGTVNDLHRSDWEAFTYMTGVSADSPYILFAVQRDANHASDTYTADAGLLGVDIEYSVTDYAL